MRRLKKIMPTVIVSLLITAVFILMSNIVLKNEKDRCWKELQETSQSLKREMNTKFDDEVVKLHLLENVMLKNGDITVSDVDFTHLDSVQSFTIFSRIDVLFPDDTFISGGIKRSGGNFRFKDVINGGEHMSERKTDFLSGKESVYYILPVDGESGVSAAIIGVIELNELKSVFTTTVYNNKANVSLIDSEDGAYLMDNWHDELGNAYDLGDREKLKEYKDVDLQADLKNLKTGVCAFYSRTTGKPIYMYYTAIGMFDWQLSVFASENVLFKEFFYMRKIIVYVGTAQILLIAIYFFHNLSVVNGLEKSYAEIERQKEQLKNMSYRDGLTLLFNRHKYVEDLTAFKGENLTDVGAAYIDLNDLKEINDKLLHDAGDRYLCKAAEIILNSFENAYRVGGDEFVVFEINISSEAFNGKINGIKNEAKNENVGMSIGYIWTENCDDLSLLIERTEQNMYAEKEQYHKEKGNRR